MNGIKFYRDNDLPFFELKLCNTSDLAYKHHTHEEYALAIVDGGKSTFWYDGQRVEVAPNALVFLPPNLIHSCNPTDPDNWQYKMLFIDPNWVRRLMASREDFTLDKPCIRYIAKAEELTLFNQMIETLTDQVTPLEKETSILNVFDLLFQAECNPCSFCVHKERPKLNLIRKYLEQFFLEKVTLDSLEQVSGINKFYILRLFKATYKVPPHAYQLLLRVNYAKRELRKQRVIADIAAETGFYDQSHFIKVFKSHTGVTPEKYQKC